MTWARCRLDWVAAEVRQVVDATRLNVDEVFHYSIPVLDESGDGRIEPAAEIGSGKLLLRGGEVLISKLNPRIARVLTAERHDVPTLASTEFIALQVSDRLERRYLVYLLSSEAVRQSLDAATMSVTRSQQRVRPEVLTKSWHDLPAIGTQRAIADYLDAETGRIDALIAKKQRMIEVLEERLQTAIRARLSNLSAPVLPLKRAWRVVDCKHRTPTYVDEGFPVVSPGDVSPGRLDLSRATRFVSIEDLDDLADGPRRPRRGDIIYSRNASIGTAAYVDTDDRFCMGQDVCLITSVDHDQLFLTYVLNTVGLDQLDIQKIGSTFSRVNISQIIELLVPVPARSVQEELAGELDRMSAQSRLAQAKLQHQIVLLREHRRALITAAVTGELEVTGVAA